MYSLAAEEIFVITATLNPPVVSGPRVMAMINGGVAEGRINGKVLPIGGEFGSFMPFAPPLTAPDTFRIDVRAAIVTDDGADIYITYSGYMHSDPATLQMLFSPKGGSVDPSKYYWRTNPLFETSVAKYAWLNSVVGIGLGSYTPDGKVQYRIFEIK